MRKTYVAIVRDHSLSMQSLKKGAAADYNNVVDSIKQASIETDEDTYVTVVECGRGSLGEVRRVETNTSVHRMKPMTDYITDGRSTPLWDSIGEAINTLSVLESIDKEDGAFLVMVITDGEENSSKLFTAHGVADKIRALQKTDRWTFTMRVPTGYSKTVINVGIPAGNVIEWDQTESSLKRSSVQTQESIKSYFRARSTGQRSTTKFYADLADIKPTDLKVHLKDVTGTAKIYPVSVGNDGAAISEFVTQRRGSYVSGQAMYQLTKTETVQDHKSIAIRDRHSGRIYTGAVARQMLNLPAVGSVRLQPGDFGNYEVFVQSTSHNRKLVGGTTVLYFN
jgi:hypothetical protein